VRGLPRERDARGARLDALNAGLGVGRALGIDRDERVVLEAGRTRRECVAILVHLPGIVLLAVDGDGAGGEQEARDERVAEEGGGGEVMDLAPHGGADDERVDEVVGVIDAEEHRPLAGHALRVSHVDRLEEEPEPEPRDGAHRAVEAIHALPRAHAA